ncbi:MAG: hypothetical protein JWQ30_577 [Sediminibacterium sp.]|nr:hypothetical protein [Sediminibacterium sp.]
MKKLCLLVIFYLSVSHLSAQKFMHGLGSTASLIKLQDVYEYDPSFYTSHGPVSFIHLGVTYFPRYLFPAGGSASFDIGIPLSLGIGVNLNSDSKKLNSGLAMSYELPLVVDYNMGSIRSPENDKETGLYFGLGYSFSYINPSTRFVFNGATQGPLVRAGIRFDVSPTLEKQKPASLGFFFKTGSSSIKFSTIGLNLMFDL